MPALAELTESSQCATTSATKLFSPVVQARISGAIVERLRSAMREGRLRPGDRLPCERELCLRFGVSRVTLREALRILELAGLLEVRLGARGGAIVVAPSAAKVGEAVVDALTMSSLLADQLLEVCSAMELGMVDLVCERAEGEDLACLERICERAELALASGRRLPELSSEFHARLVRIGHNRALDLLFASLGETALARPAVAEVAGTPLLPDAIAQEHRALLEAIKAADSRAARSILESHFCEVRPRDGLCLQRPQQGVALAATGTRLRTPQDLHAR